jgi:hypothetical protein
LFNNSEYLNFGRLNSDSYRVIKCKSSLLIKIIMRSLMAN